MKKYTLNNGILVVTGVDGVGCDFQMEPLIAQANLAVDAVAALRLVADDEPCRLDHHGECQTHSLLNPYEQFAIRSILARAAALTEPTHAAS